MTPKEKVEMFLKLDIEDTEKFPLCFHNFEDRATMKQIEKVKTFDKISLDDLIIEILYLLKRFGSENTVTNVLETGMFKYRSALDIWRHVIYFQKNHTLLDVMDTIYKNSDKLYGQYCTDVSRRVFMKKDVGQNHLGVELTGEHDEFGLLFFEWNNINEE